MVKKSSAKQRYLELQNVRVTYDHKFDKIHLTAKDSDLPEGFHLTLNAGRKAEQSLRRVLTEHGLIREMESPEDTPAVDPQVFHYGESPEGPLLWDFKKSHTGSVIGRTGRGVILNSLIEHCHKHEDSWDLYIINLRNQKLRQKIDEYPTLISRHTHTIEEALHLIGSFAALVRDRRILVEEHDVETYQELNLNEKTPMLIIDDLSALLCSEIELDGSVVYENKFRKKIDDILEYIHKNAEIAGVKIAASNRENKETTFDNTVFVTYHYLFKIHINLDYAKVDPAFKEKMDIPIVGQVFEHREDTKLIREIL